MLYIEQIDNDKYTVVQDCHTSVCTLDEVLKILSTPVLNEKTDSSKEHFN